MKRRRPPPMPMWKNNVAVRAAIKDQEEVAVNGSMWFRGLVRFWRVGAAISGVIVVALVAMLIIGRNSDASVSNGKAALITNTNAPPPTTAPVAAATTAAGRAAPAAAAPGTTGSAVSGVRRIAQRAPALPAMRA